LTWTIKEDIIEVVEFDFMLVGSGAGTTIDLHHLLLGPCLLLVILQQDLSMALADQTLQWLQSTLLQKLSDVALDWALRIELTLLSEINGRLDIGGNPRQDKEGLFVLSVICIVETDEEPDLGGAEALTELVLEGSQGIHGILLQVNDGSLSFQGFLIEAHNILWTQLRL
jgi:hypothetical protein